MISMNGSILPMSTLLPADVRAQLVAASKVDKTEAVDLEPGESDARIAAVDAAIASVREAYPGYFRQNLEA